MRAKIEKKRTEELSRRKFLKTCCGIIGLASAGCRCEPPTAPDKPNIVLIMADDLGYHDLGCYGHSKIKTPVLDQLAKDGMRLTSFYSGATVCTPSRMALLTGAYPTRLGWEKGVIGYKMGSHDGMNPEALTIAEIFESEGYATAISGKWHLGDQPETRPHRQGFDSAYYIDKSNNQTRKMWRGDELIDDRIVNRLLTERFTVEAIRFIKEKKDKPFFLYMPYTAPHFPVEAHPDWKGKSRFGEYGDVVEELDFRIGQILKTLKELKIDKNTIVVFLSDNGPNPHEKADSLPYRGEKWSALEGGTRVPAIVSWPGIVPAGQESDALMGALDLLPTLCHACEIDWRKKSTGKPVIDGVNVWDTILGKKGDHPRKDLLYWHGMGGFHAIRAGNWKLFFNRQHAVSGLGTARKTPEQAQMIANYSSGDAPLLYNLKDDPGETIDLSDKYPDKVKEMKALADKRMAEIKSGNILPIHKSKK